MKLEEAEEIFKIVSEYGDDYAISESFMLEAYDTIIDARDARLVEMEEVNEFLAGQNEMLLNHVGEIPQIERERDEARKDAVEMASMLLVHSEDSYSQYRAKLILEKYKE